MDDQTEREIQSIRSDIVGLAMNYAQDGHSDFIRNSLINKLRTLAELHDQQRKELAESCTT